MKLHEYQSKAIYSKNNIPVPKGRLAVTAEEARHITEELGGRVVIKAQVLVGGRGKAGGVRLAKSPKEAEDLAAQILSMEIKGLPVQKILVDEAISIDREIYLAVTIDRAVRMPVLITSCAGGVDIEEVAYSNPEKMSKTYIDPLLGLKDYQVRDAAAAIDLPHVYWKSFVEICRGLWNTFITTDGTLTEINPLVITTDQRLLALDGKIIIDDNALFRHPDLIDFRDLESEDFGETEARKYGLSFVRMEGDIGCLVNGAGLAMATMDMIKLFGGRPANFLDIGGGASAEKVAAAFRILLADQNIKSILVNIFGGITRCDEVANGILSVISSNHIQIPIVTRLVGTNAETGNRILEGAHLHTASTLIEAAQKAIQLSQEAPIEHIH